MVTMGTVERAAHIVMSLLILIEGMFCYVPSYKWEHSSGIKFPDDIVVS